MGLLDWLQNNINESLAGIQTQRNMRDGARQFLTANGATPLQAAFDARNLNPFAAVATGFGGITSPVGKLPMDTASRMARAEAQGFRSDMPMYHSTRYDFNEFVPSNWRGASYLADSPVGAQNGASAGGMEHPALGGPSVQGAKETGSQIMPVLVRGKIFGVDQFPEQWLPPKEINRSEWKALRDDYKNWKPENADQFTQAELNSLRYLRVNALDSYDTHPDFLLRLLNASDDEMKALGKIDEPMLRGNTVATPMGWEGFEGPQGLRWREALRKAGFTGAAVNDEAGTSIAMLDPSAIRSRFAAFDPSKINSKDLLASFGGLLGLGAAADQAQQYGLLGP